MKSEEILATALEFKLHIPPIEKLDKNIETMKNKIPKQMLGYIKRVFNSALKLELETSESWVT